MAFPAGPGCVVVSLVVPLVLVVGRVPVRLVVRLLAPDRLLLMLDANPEPQAAIRTAQATASPAFNREY